MKAAAMRSNNNQKGLAGRKIGLFGKGGAGKSTAVVLLARALAEAGYTVCVIDADSTNVGLNRALGVEQAPSPLIEYFGGMIFSGGMVTCPVDDPTPLAGAEVTLERMPLEYYARVGPQLYLFTLGKLGQWGAGGGCDGPISKIARDIRVQVDAEPVVTLIDFKAGFEDSARGVVSGLDWVVVVVDPTQASLVLALHMKQMVRGIRAGQLPATRHLESPDLVALANRLFQEARLQGALFVLNRFPDEKTESFARRQLATSGIEPMGVIRDDPSISDAWLTGASINVSSTRADVQGIVEALEKAAVEPAATT
jgi:CO dehydrogenase nickel-insertion accessory protein CooC1